MSESKIKELEARLKSLEDWQQGLARAIVAAPQPQPKPQPQKPAATTEHIEDLRKLFPEDLEDMLKFEDKGDYVKISPKEFLGSETFAKVASVVRGLGGEYISAGKESHFRVPKK